MVKGTENKVELTVSPFSSLSCRISLHATDSHWSTLQNPECNRLKCWQGAHLFGLALTACSSLRNWQSFLVLFFCALFLALVNGLLANRQEILTEFAKATSAKC